MRALLALLILSGCTAAIIDCEVTGGTLTKDTTESLKSSGLQPIWRPCP